MAGVILIAVAMVILVAVILVGESLKEVHG